MAHLYGFCRVMLCYVMLLFGSCFFVLVLSRGTIDTGSEIVQRQNILYLKFTENMIEHSQNAVFCVFFFFSEIFFH